jgi:hypothetical protein
MSRPSGPLAAVAPLLFLVGCYSPRPADRGFRCDTDLGGLCPEGLHCDAQIGLCVSPSSVADMSYPGIDFSLDAAPLASPRSCDERVRAGAFTGLTNLTAANSASDERSLSLTPDGKRIYFLRAGALFTATIDGKNASAATAVTGLTGTVDTINGGSLTKDGSYWFSGTKAGVTKLYTGSFTAPTALSVSATAHLPQATCAFADPVFADGKPDGELYLSYPLTGCGQVSYVAQGQVDKNIGAFFSALVVPGYRAPTLLPGALTLLVSSTDTNRIYYAERPSGDAQWTGTQVVPLDALGAPSTADRQALVSPDCATLYLVADRDAGQGGSDLWAADIAGE